MHPLIGALGSLAPPPEVMDEVARAAERAAELAAAGFQLHFEPDAAAGRVAVSVRDLDGNLVRTISAAQALAVMAGADL